jgi:hypothetical protein
LKVIRQVDGIPAFTKFTNNLMSKWGISDHAQREWRPFFSGWAQYAQLCFSRNNQYSSATSAMDDVEVDNLPRLTEYCYLDHLEYFQQLYRTGKYKVELCTSRLQGLVVIVAPKLETSCVVADYVAERLGGPKRMTGLDDLTATVMNVACNPGQGLVCNVAMEHGFAKIRKHLKDFADFISIGICAGSEVNLPLEVDVEKEQLAVEEKKKMAGILKGWKNTRCARVVEFPDIISIDQHSCDDVTSFKPSDMLNELLSQLEVPVVADARPGVLVFFPAIPGSGKSTWVAHVDRDVTAAKPNRAIFVQEGDKTKGKFWPCVKKTRRRAFSGIHIADKNAPSSVWGVIGEICATTKALAVPVLPDKTAVRTTRVDGIRKRDGTIVSNVSHVYPFSLLYLAVCMTRVMDRPAGSHAGQLDQSTQRSCLIVVKFYSFYRSLSAEEFILSLTTSLAGSGALVTPAPIEVPFFRGDSTVDCLPEDVEVLLLEALRCQVSHCTKRIYSYLYWLTAFVRPL